MLKVLVQKQKALVEGINMVTKATKPNAQHPREVLIKMEAPVHIQSFLIDPKSGKPTRISCRRNER